MLRVLIIEDNPERERPILAGLPSDVKGVVARSAGLAIGILRRDPGKVYSGVILDHDLHERQIVAADAHLNGQDVVGAIAQYVDRAVPVLIHSMNATQRAVMARTLERAGFEVTTIPMNLLDREAMCEWLRAVRDNATD